jgi:hypothetical protein
MKPPKITSPTGLLRWAVEMRMQADELWAACDDATRPPSERTLGRPEARRLAREAHKAIGQMLEALLLELAEMSANAEQESSSEPSPSSTGRGQ